MFGRQLGKVTAKIKIDRLNVDFIYFRRTSKIFCNRPNGGIAGIVEEENQEKKPHFLHSPPP
jgi:hypothetical protein